MSEGQSVVQIQQSSLFVQVLVHYHWRYLIFYFLASICFFVFKKYRYYYPARIMGWEFFPVFLLVFVDGTRLLMLSRGNKMSAMSSLIYSFFWSIPVITLYAFYLDLQTYILRADIVINALALALTGSEVLASMWLAFSVHDVPVFDRRWGAEDQHYGRLF